MSLPFEFLDKRPIVIAVAGSNGAGKSTFYQSFLADAGLRFINADVLSAALGVNAYEAAELASSIRAAHVVQRGRLRAETVNSTFAHDNAQDFKWLSANVIFGSSENLWAHNHR